jgi:hypothetical protein
LVCGLAFAPTGNASIVSYLWKVTPTMERLLYLIEYYTRHEKTGEEGWFIRFAWVWAESGLHARRRMEIEIPHFDCVITCGRQSEITPLWGCDGPDDVITLPYEDPEEEES